MSTLIFRPNTHIDANMFQYRINSAGIRAEYDVFSGDFIIETADQSVDIEMEIECNITYDIEGHLYWARKQDIIT